MTCFSSNECRVDWNQETNVDQHRKHWQMVMAQVNLPRQTIYLISS